MYELNDEGVNNIFTRETTLSGNGAIKLASTNNIFVDDFGNLSKFKSPRNYVDIFSTMKELYNADKLLALKETFYLRLITRKTIVGNTKLTTQIGTGLKNEFLYRMIWLMINDLDVFNKNLYLIPLVGSYYDIFQLLRISYDFKIDNSLLYYFILKSLQDDSVVNLIKKYLPTIKSKKHCTTKRNTINSIIGKHIAKDLFVYNSYERYRKFKAQGTAHDWEQKISQQNYSELDFSKIAGRALSKLAKSKFLDNHNLTTKFEEWLDKQPVAKFTGYPYELFKDSFNSSYKKSLVNKQFQTLLDNVKDCNSSYIVAVDTSGSMQSTAAGTNTSSINVAFSMALYFAHLLKGIFCKTWLEFADNTKVRTLDGYTYVDQFEEMLWHEAYGSTNFISIAELFVSKFNGSNESEFPTGLICISDGEFNGCGNSTNNQAFRNILLDGGFSKDFVNNFKIILWDIPNNFYNEGLTSKFESLANEPNIFYMSGLDPSGISFMFGKEQTIPKTAKELFEKAMNQDLLNMVSI